MRTETQKQHMNDTCINLYNKIVAFKQQFGYLPSIREMCKLTDTASTSMLRGYLQVLQDWGWLEIPKGTSRAMRLTRPTEMDVLPSIRQAVTEHGDRLEASGALEAR